jgi:hypothetical protein
VCSLVEGVRQVGGRSVCTLPQALWDGKGFLREVVSNWRNGLDVDKYDYLVRDAAAAGIKTGCDVSVIMEHARVVDDQICYRKSHMCARASVRPSGCLSVHPSVGLSV